MNDHDVGWIIKMNVLELCTICTHARLKAHNSAQLRPFYVILMQNYVKFRRGSRGNIENAVAIQQHAVCRNPDLKTPKDATFCAESGRDVENAIALQKRGVFEEMLTETYLKSDVFPTWGLLFCPCAQAHPHNN